eukprot:48809_1
MQGSSQPLQEGNHQGSEPPLARVSSTKFDSPVQKKRRRNESDPDVASLKSLSKKAKRIMGLEHSHQNPGQQFRWTSELHDDFLASLFDVGLQHATPALLQQVNVRYVLVIHILLHYCTLFM